MSASFHEVRFPLRLSLSVSGGPVRRTDIVSLSNGRENRNQRWKNSRRSYDAGSALRSVADLYELTAFFEARGGELYVELQGARVMISGRATFYMEGTIHLPT